MTVGTTCEWGLDMIESGVGHTLDVPGARLYYEVRGQGPVLMMIGLPMDSGGFAGLASALADRYTTVTYDPRGFGRSTIDDPDEDADPELVADDISRLLATVGAGPALIFGSSGGATTGLALVSAHPEQVRTLVAHEPPLIELLPDASELRAATEDVYQTYLAQGQGAAFPKFMRMAGFPMPEPGQAPPGPPPSPEQIASGERMLAHSMRPTTSYRPPIDRLRAVSTRIVPALGAASAGQVAHRGAAALAEQLGTEPVEFPGDHGGFLGEPERFGDRLEQVLGSAG